MLFFDHKITLYIYNYLGTNALSKKCSTKVVDPCDELFVLRMEIRDGSKPVLAYGFFSIENLSFEFFLV